MAYYHVGELIKKLRKQRNMTQEQLAGVDISRITLSRIENGKQMPEKVTLDILLERLGYSSRDFNGLLLSEEEFKIHALRDELSGYIANFKTAEAEALIVRMERMESFQIGRNRQFLLTCKASNLFNKGTDLQTAYEWLDEAIRMFIPKFHENMISTYYLSHEEVDIINNMANIHDAEGRSDEAIFIMEKLADNIRKNCVDEREKTKSLGMILYNLSCYLGLNEQHKKALTVCEEGITLCLQNRIYNHLPELTYNKACSLYYLGRREESRALFYQAYYGCAMMGKEDNCVIIKKHAEEDFGVVF